MKVFEVPAKYVIAWVRDGVRRQQEFESRDAAVEFQAALRAQGIEAVITTWWEWR